MQREAGEAPQACARFLADNAATLQRLGERLRARPPRFVVTCARGSSDHAATYGKYLFETYLGLPTVSAALSVTSIFGAAPRPGEANEALCIAISQSGRSPDLLAAVTAQKEAGALIVALVNDETSPLAELADEVLPLRAGPELSVAATKSFIASLFGLAALTAYWREDTALLEGLLQLPAVLDAAFARDWSAALPDLTAATNLFVIGRGYGLATAQEAALKLKETCGLHAEAFSSAEVRHGPMAIIGEGFPVLAFATADEAGDDVRAACASFRERGAKVWLADAGPEGNLPSVSAADAALEPMVQILSFYRFANALSLARGLNPDNPPHLLKVTRTV